MGRMTIVRLSVDDPIEGLKFECSGAYSLGILAGGQGARWGGRDKGLIAYQDARWSPGLHAAPARRWRDPDLLPEPPVFLPAFR